ncbi:dynamin family protein [Acinetobacter junii]|uniref:Dynamin family protein n=1 Tax=Acinetobacter junii TaxID=40215 RepID=A0AAX1MDT5_ACIJU|nr:dynamin family protein [Acinetobacter junii]QUY35424.1 dynamin family protein [Acinetobacter junii]
MNSILIEYNPFSIETNFFIDGKELTGNNILSDFKYRRLQLWVDQLPKILYEFFNYDFNINIDFIGLESDYIDIKEEIDKANSEYGANILLAPYQSVEGVDIRLEKIQGMIDKAKKNPKFLSYLENNSKISVALKEAFNNDFDAYVVATMSSGKSTFINAMLGTDLLPARNEATTATIAKIFDTKVEKYWGARCNKNGEILDENHELNSDVLNNWNDQIDTHTIDIEGPIYGMQKRDNVRLVLTDTPGPNNSRDDSHAQLTMSFIQDSQRSPLILYILNATQLGINDDKNLLRLVAKEIKRGGKQAKDRFIFIVNKCDEFDLEKESLEKALKNVRDYLEENGIQDPLVYPISAYAARLMRNNEQSLTSRERRKKNDYIDQFLEEDYNFIKYMPLTAKVSSKVQNLKLTENSELNLALKNSGIPAVEMMIDEYIEKYNFPHRLNRAKEALDEAIKLALNEEEIILSLADNEAELQTTLNAINVLEEKRNHGFKTEAYKKKLKDNKNKIPNDIHKRIKDLRIDVSATLLSAGNTMRGEVNVDQANMKLDKIENNLSFKFKEVINELDKAYIVMQENIRVNLNSEYQKYVASIFEDVKALKLPVLAGLEDKFKNLDISIVKTTNSEIKTRRVVVGQREVKDSNWWNPFSWGRKKLVDITEERESVVLDELWKARSLELRKPFDQLLEDGMQHIQHGANDIVDLYVKFMSAEFDKQFDSVILELTEKIKDKDKRLHAINLAKQELKWIEDFRSELNSTLMIKGSH